MTEEKTSGQKTEYCKKFLQLAENLDEMVYKMDIRSGEFEYVNQSSVNITGYTPEEFYQTPFLIKNIVHLNWKHYIDVNFSRLIEGECTPAFEFQIIDKDNRVKWLYQKNILINDKEG